MVSVKREISMMSLLPAQLILLFTLLLAGSPEVSACPRKCTLRSNGALTLFNQETATVASPCKYRLADFTCGDYQVKVTGGSAKADDGAFHPNTLFVKITQNNTSDFVKARTSLKRLLKHEANDTVEVWQTAAGNTTFLDVAGYVSGYAVLEKRNVFNVRINPEKVEVCCKVTEGFSSKGFPDTLCGDYSTSDAIEAARKQMLGEGSDVTAKAFLQYVIFNDVTVTQSKTCRDLASKFQSCDKKDDAIARCSEIFSDPSQAECLATPSLANFYSTCLQSVCDGDSSASNTLDCTPPVSLHCKLFGGKEDLEKTASFVSLSGLTIYLV